MLSDSNDAAYESKPLTGSFNVAKPENQRKHIPSASSALVIGSILGIVQAVLLIALAKPLLSFMGIHSVSSCYDKKLFDLILLFPLIYFDGLLSVTNLN